MNISAAVVFVIDGKIEMFPCPEKDVNDLITMREEFLKQMEATSFENDRFIEQLEKEYSGA